MLLLVLLSTSTTAQADAEGGPMPIALTVAPTVALVGAKVLIAGTTVPDGKRFNVTITITPEGSAATAIPTQIDKGGAFKASFAATTAPGRYGVRAVAPDGQGVATANFRVLSAANVGVESAAAAANAFAATKKLEAALRTAVKGLADSPAKEQLTAKLDALDAKLAESPAIEAEIDRAMKLVADLPQRAPRLAAAVEPTLTKLAAWSAREASDVEERDAKIDAELAASRSAGAVCEGIDKIEEGFQAVSATLSFIAEPIDILKNLATDFLSSNVVSAAMSNSGAYNDNTAFVATEFSKNLMAFMAGPPGWVAAAIGVAADAGAFAAEKFFSQYCERFGGPFQTTMRGEVFAEQGGVWRTFSFALDGKLNLRYPKGAAGSAIHMTGEFAGSAHDYKSWDDALRVLYPKLMRGAQIYKKSIDPISMPYVDFEGRGAANLSPAAFVVSATADLVGKKLTVHIGPATSEINETYNRTVVINAIMSPLTFLPVVVQYPLPFPQARVVLMRALDADDGNLELDVTIDSKSMTAKREVDRVKPGAGVKGAYTGKLRLCNPACAK
jgi:hypothetical protein